MQTIQIITKEDVIKLVGKYVIELNHNEHNENIKENTPFWIEKRISIIQEIPTERKSKSLYCFCGLQYLHSQALDEDGVVEMFNAIGKDRYYRLLSLDEIHYIIDYMHKIIKKD